MAVHPDYLLEYRRLGAFVKVSAVDPATGIEVSVTGPLNSEAALAHTAVAKLERRLAKRAKPAGGGPDRGGLTA